jgi:endonuclease/exonuclease/phosphatase family metal-dependent hydrolase
MVRLDIVTWNVNGFATKRQPELLARLRWDVCAIQEATTPEALDLLATRAGATSWCSAREHLTDEHAERAPRYVSAVLARGPARVVDSHVLDGAPSPERALVARVELAGVTLTMCSMALPPATSPAWGREKKAEQCAVIVAFLAKVADPAIVGIDANTPRRDAIDLADTAFWNPGEDRLLGPAPAHPFRDLYREHVERDGTKLAEARLARPEGPLAVSYVRRGRGTRYESRYDFLLGSPSVEVIDADYDYEAACDAGSDHAVVSARVALTS